MRFLAHGGVYIAGGGIAAKLIDRIKDGRVLKAYLDQGSRRTKTPPVLLDPAKFALVDQSRSRTAQEICIVFSVLAGVSTEVVENCPLYVSDMADMGMAGVRSAARSIVLSDSGSTL